MAKGAIRIPFRGNQGFGLNIERLENFKTERGFSRRLDRIYSDVPALPNL